jgi:hypothetical protein
MASTRRPNLPDVIPPAAPAETSYAQWRRAEQREARWRRKLPPWGGRNPVTSLWEMPERPARGDRAGSWESNPEGWGVIAHDVAPDAASWTKVRYSRAERRYSGTSDFDRLAVNLIRSGQARAEPGPTPTRATEVTTGPRRYGRDAVVGRAPDRSAWESQQAAPEQY